jgi:cysteine desulfurase family protein (TIGR01976 family)
MKERTTGHDGDSVSTVEEIRARFPALERRHAGEPVAYFDGPGGTQVPRLVVDLVADYLYNHNANTHWVYPTSVETDEVIANSRAALADFLNATPEDIIFGQNMTTLTFHLARSLGRGWSEGDEVVVTELDHHANIAPWRALEAERGVVVRSVQMKTEDGTLDMEDLERQIGPRTRLLAVGAASNALGTVSDVAAACALARQAGVLTFVDAVHYAPHKLVDVRKIGCDFLACSAYKFYGPHIGVLFGRASIVESLDVPKLAPAPSAAPERMETGTLSHEGIAGAAAAVDFLASLAPANGSRRDRLTQTFDALHDRGEALLRWMWDGLSAIDGVRLYGPPPGSPRTPTVSFTVQGHPPARVASLLAERGVFLSTGDFYATTVAERYGVAGDGFIRAGCACYTSPGEVERLVAGVGEVVGGRSSPRR